MIIRTISQLPKTSSELPSDSLFEVSVKRDIQYISKAVSFGQLQQQINSNTEQEIAHKYGLVTTTGKVNSVDRLNYNVNQLSAGDVKLFGDKDFQGSVQLSSIEYEPGKDYSGDRHAVNAEFIQKAIGNLPSFVSKDSSYTAGIAADGMEYSSTSLMKFTFDQKSRTSKVLTCPKTGNLVMYGWLADTGKIDTAAAWVALEGLIGAKTPVWMILQLQPWIIGEKHSNLQYVGFNMPVTAGLQLRVTTGFELNYANSTYQNRMNSLVKNIDISGTNMTNAFLGYVVS